MTARRSAHAVLLTSIAVAMAGCGNSQEESANAASAGNELASSDAARVLQAKRAIDAQCSAGGNATNRGQLATAVSTLVDITKSSAGRVYETGNVARALEMSTVANETAEQLRGCGVADEADRLVSAAKQ